MKIGIVGVGHGKFGRRDDATVQELAFEALRAALDDARNMERKDIDAVIVGSSPEYHKQRSLPGAITEYLGMNDKPTWLTEAACASSSAALRSAYMAIKSGMHDTVLVLGVQKMTELTTAEIQGLMGRVGDVQWESIYGTTFPGYYAMYANRHMSVYGTTGEQLAGIAVKSHHYGSMNQYAMFQKEITLEKALSSPLVAYPLRLYDCCANADGAVALVLTSDALAKRYTDAPVWIEGLGCASAPISVLRRPDMTSIPSAVAAAREAYRMAGVEPKEIDVADVHDCFTIAEIMAIEDIGFVEKGKGGWFEEEGETYIGGKHPVNVDGGLKAKGHPVGATGASQTAEIVKQLRGECGKRQVAGAEIGLTHNVGGIGQYCFVHIYKR
ncbi:MAG: thiolase domain-containing protein [Candidatus Thermoplasmatota archaeon]